MEYCAAIDFGTNTARLLIAERTSVGIFPVLIERQVVRLGGGFTDESGLSEAAWLRGMACLKRFAGIIDNYGIKRVKASATSAVRDAVNGREFVEAVLRETGISLVVIGGDLEARITLSGVLSGLDTDKEPLVMLDVGGGSTEFTVSIADVPVFVKSMPIGVVRLTEGFSTENEMSLRVQSIISELESDVVDAGFTVDDSFELVATAGTATTIAAVKMGMVDYDYRKVNNCIISREDIDQIYSQLSILTPMERLSVAGVEKGREDLIIAGLITILSIMDRFGFRRLKISDSGLLEGLALLEDGFGWDDRLLVA